MFVSRVHACDRPVLCLLCGHDFLLSLSPQSLLIPQFDEGARLLSSPRGMKILDG